MSKCLLLAVLVSSTGAIALAAETTVEHQVEQAAWKSLTRPWNVPLPSDSYEQQGCLECRNTGFLGRVGLYEMLKVSPELRQLVTDDTNSATIREQGIKQGMQPLRISGARKVASGITTMSEVLRVIPRAHDGTDPL